MSRLPDGRYQCPACHGTFEREQMRASDMSYCRSCSKSKQREAYALRMAAINAGLVPKRARNTIPDGFVKVALGKSDETLAGLYGVSAPTVARWRKRLGLADTRPVMPPDFARLAANMTGDQVAAAFNVHRTTAYRWLNASGAQRARGRPAGPVPADWADVCARLNTPAVARRYGVTSKVVRRWARQSGVEPIRKAAAPPVPRRSHKASPVLQPRPEQPSTRPVAVTPIHTNGCRDCTPKSLCRVHQTAQLEADMAAWLAQGNRPREVPQGASGMHFGWTRPAQ